MLQFAQKLALKKKSFVFLQNNLQHLLKKKTGLQRIYTVVLTQKLPIPLKIPIVQSTGPKSNGPTVIATGGQCK